MTAEQLFIKYSVEKLNQQAERISNCLDKLNEDQIWARHSDSENAIGNLVLHLCGNLRQWIGFGVGGKPDIRVRDREFSARAGAGTAELKERLETAVSEASEIIRSLTPVRLVEITRVQSYEMSVLEAVYHVVEHFSGHAGQIMYATKQLTGADLGFYRDLQQPAHSEQVP